jgi:hypothetical protein
MQANQVNQKERLTQHMNELSIDYRRGRNRACSGRIHRAEYKWPFRPNNNRVLSVQHWFIARQTYCLKDLGETNGCGGISSKQ